MPLELEVPPPPELKGDHKKEREENKGSGVPATFGTGVGSGGALAAGGAGVGAAGGGSVGTGLLGGLLATKAGLIALIVGGMTFVGGLGLVGSKIFGGGSAKQTPAQANTLFAAHPKQAVQDLEGYDAEEKMASAGKGGGTSSSLQMLADGNNTLPLDPVEKTEDKKETSDAANASAAPPPPGPAEAAKAAMAAAAPAANNNAPGMGPAAKLTFSSKIGQLSNGVGSGASGAHFGASGGIGASSQMDSNKLLASLGKNGNTSAMSAGRAFLGSGKGVGDKARRGGAVRQLNNVLADQRGAMTSADAGRTYDGGATRGGTTGAMQGGAPQQSATDTGPSPNQAGQGGNSLTTPGSPLPAAPADVDGVNVTPWQKQMTLAKVLMGGAIAAIAAGWLLAKYSETVFHAAVAEIKTQMANPDNISAGKAMQLAAKQMYWAATIQKAVLALWAAAGLAFLGALGIGVNIMGGQFGQTTAGLSFLLGGGFGAVAAGLAVKSILPSITSTTNTAITCEAYGQYVEAQGIMAHSDPASEAYHNAQAQWAKAYNTQQALGQDALNASFKTFAEGEIKPLGAAPLLMSVCGGAAVVAFGITMLTSPKQVPQRECPNHSCHDLSLNRPVPTFLEEPV